MNLPAIAMFYVCLCARSEQQQAKPGNINNSSSRIGSASEEQIHIIIVEAADIIIRNNQSNINININEPKPKSKSKLHWQTRIDSSLVREGIGRERDFKKEKRQTTNCDGQQNERAAERATEI